MGAEIAATGLDPLVGVYHQPRAGKPALACDLMEPFRAPLVDQLVLAQVRKGIFRREHFTDSDKGVRLRPDDFRRFLKAFEERFAASSGQSFAARVRSTVEQFAADVRKWARDRGHPAVDGP